MVRRIDVDGNQYRLGDDDAHKLASYLRRLGGEDLADRIIESRGPHELTEEETNQLWQAIDRVWLAEEGIDGMSRSVLRLRDALHASLNP